jgi:hypothetical protein
MKATGPDGITIPPTPVTRSGEVLTLNPTLCKGKFPDMITYYNKNGDGAPVFLLDWQMSMDNGVSWSPVGSTHHTVYVTLAAPLTVGLSQETLFYIGCKYANGRKTSNNMIQGVWAHFKGLNVTRVDGTELYYYQSYNAGATGTRKLIATGDGQCTAWANFFLDVLKTQGFQKPDNYVTIMPLLSSNDNGFIVKSWTFHGQGTSGHANYPFINLYSEPFYLDTEYNWVSSQEVTKVHGSISGQGPNPNPPSVFPTHTLTYVNGRYYDPSYGKDYATLQGIDNLAIDGFVRREINWSGNGIQGSAFLFRKNPAGLDIDDNRESY